MAQLDQLDYLIMEALADMNKAPANMERKELETLVNDMGQYSELVSWASSELQCVSQTEEAVHPVQTPEDLPNFQMEYSGLLKELGCPYNNILEQSMGNRFDTSEKRKVLLNFLISELQAARILHVNSTKAKSKQLKVELDESPTAKVLREISMELGLGKPPESITVAALWNNINGKVGGLLKTTGSLDPLFDGFLSPNQWSQIEKYFEELNADYQKRREMLLKRLDVTIQSFHWSDRLKGQKAKDINEKFQKHRPHLNPIPNVKVSDVLAARIDLPIVEKTASASVRRNTKSAVNNVVIGRVPDRGGRTDEIQPPPPEMPPWQQRQGGAPPGTSGWIQGGQQSRGGGGGGGNRGRGGRVQGGWSDSGQRGGGGGGRQQQNNYNNQQYDNRNSGGGYNNQQQGQYDNRGGYNNHQQQQQFYDNRGGSGSGYQQNQTYNSSGGGFYQHDDRGAVGGGYKDQYHQHGQGHQHQQHGGGGRRDNRYDDSRDNYRGGRGGGGRGRRY